MTEIIKAQIERGPNGEKDPNDWALTRPGAMPIRRAPEKNPLGWVMDFQVSEEEINKLADPEWIFPNLIISGHMIVIPAEPNAGKTTIMEWICGQISDSHNVVYVNADISGGDAKEAHRKAQSGGYTLLLPDMKTGRSMDDVVEALRGMTNITADFSDTVMVFDTLKKMTDVINKKKSKELYKLLRSLSAKGMTIVLLAHTNKYKSKDGRPVFEGTGDLRSDVDEMIYLDPIKHADGSMTVSTQPDKVRGKFEPITFEISPERQVSLTDYVNTAAHRSAKKTYERDAQAIEAVTEAISSGKHKQSEIVEFCRGHKIADRQIRRVLSTYAAGPYQKWHCERGSHNNTKLYNLC